MAPPDVPVSLPGIGSLVLGRYAIVALRGAGMMGIVLEADDRVAGCRVALKILRPDVASSVDLRTRLEREAHIVASLRSEHVVRVYDFGTTEQGLPFFVMELLEGMDLDQRLQTGEGFDIDEAVRLVREACDGLAEAHARGVVHRDLKPHNLFLARGEDGQVHVKILDFGISKLSGQDSRLTQTNATLGTPMYMSPEQVRSARSIDGRSDVWSLAVVLFELLTGRGPFRGDTGHAIAAAIVADAAIPLRMLRPDAPEGLERALLDALCKDVEQRTPTADAFSSALAPYDRSANLSRASSRFQVGDELTMVGVPPPARPNEIRDRTELGLPPPPQAIARTETGVPTPHPALPARAVPAAPSAPALAPPRVTPPDPKRWMLVAGWALLAVLAVGALIWLGLDRRSTTRAASATAATSASAPASSASAQDLLLSEVLDAARASNAAPAFEPCILSETTGSLPALLPRTSLVEAVRDLDATLAVKRPPALVLAGGVGPSPQPGSGPTLRIAAITPLFAALRLEAVPVLIVTNRKLYVSLLGERMLEDISSAEHQAQLKERLVTAAPGWVVLAEGGLPLSRLRAALALLARTPGSVVLAVPIEGAGPAEPPPIASNDPLACPAHFADGALPLPDSERALLQPALSAVGESCGQDAPLSAGRSVRLVARVGGRSRSPRDACIEADETGSDQLRSCALGAVKKIELATSAAERLVRFDVAFGAPRVSALCPAP